MTTNIILAECLHGTQRVHHTSSLFGINFPLKLEPTVYAMASNLAPAYSGGFWDFFALSNGGFYMAPTDAEMFIVSSMNSFEGTLSADALGITACLFAYSHLSFQGNAFAEVVAEHFHHLREFALTHCESAGILAATD